MPLKAINVDIGGFVMGAYYRVVVGLLRAAVLFLVVGHTFFVPSALAVASPFGVIAQGTDLSANQEGRISVTFRVAAGSVLYADSTGAVVLDPGSLNIGTAVAPIGEWKDDPATGIQREVFSHDVTYTFPVSAHTELGSYPVVVSAWWQGCEGTLCTMPRDETIELNMEVVEQTSEARLLVGPSITLAIIEAIFGEANAENVDEDIVAESSSAEQSSGVSGSVLGIDLAGKGTTALILLVFLAGLGVSLTPCVLPMVPITMGIIGASAEGSRSKGLLLGLTYVAGQAMVYTALGVGAAMTGAVFGAWMQSPYVVGGVSLFFAWMGLAMFGFFNIQVPSSIQTKLASVGGAGFVGALLVGMVGALVAGPCSGPVIASLMILIGQQGELALGVSLMMSFSLGMGVIFIAAGAFSGTVLRPGAWMDTVKKGFGVILWFGAIFFAKAHLSTTTVAMLTMAVLITTAVWGWPSRNEDDASSEVKLRRLYSVVAFIVGAYLLIGLLVSRGFILGPMTSSYVAHEEVHVAWQSDPDSVLDAAAANDRPVMIDFTADWCAPCQELERETFSDEEVVELSERFELLQVDGTSPSAILDELKVRFNVQGFPTVLFLRPDGTVMEEYRLLSFEEPAEFVERMESVLSSYDAGVGEAVTDGAAGPDVDEQEPITVTVRVEGSQILVDFEQAEGWHSTEAMTFVELAPDQPVEIASQEWPESHQRPDPAYPPEDNVTRGEFDGDFTAVVALTGDPGVYEVQGTVGYQACKAERCLMPRYEDFTLEITIGEGQ